MIAENNNNVSKIISEYIGHKQRSLYHQKKMNDAEKEYNKLLAISGGEEKNFTLAEADRIYNAFIEIKNNEEQFKVAEEKFNEADEQLKELGKIIFQGTITGDITIPATNGELPSKKQVTVSFPYGQALVS